MPRVMSCSHDFQHCPRVRRGPYPRRVSASRLERSADIAGVVMLLVVGVPALTPQFRGETGPLWWVCFAAAGAALVLVLLPRVPVSRARALLGPFALAAMGVFVAAPQYPFAPVPMVAAAMAGTWLLRTRQAFGLVAVMVAVLAAVWLPGNPSLLGGVALVMYAVWMVFAALLVDGRKRVAQANDQLARANAELAAAQLRLAESSRNDERLRISRDLHDLVGHQLTALAVNLEVASHVTTGPGAERVEQCRVLAKDLLRDVRQVVGSLRYRVPDLRGALDEMARAVPVPAVHVEVPAGLTVPDELAGTLLRCAQEAITNAVRHADARNVWVRVSEADGETVLSVCDDGRGSPRVAPGNGLSGMRERLAAHGGRLAYDGVAGFRLEARLPVVAVAR